MGLHLTVSMSCNRDLTQGQGHTHMRCDDAFRLQGQGPGMQALSSLWGLEGPPMSRRSAHNEPKRSPGCPGIQIQPQFANISVGGRLVTLCSHWGGNRYDACVVSPGVERGAVALPGTCPTAPSLIPPRSRVSCFAWSLEPRLLAEPPKQGL